MIRLGPSRSSRSIILINLQGHFLHVTQIHRLQKLGCEHLWETILPATGDNT